MQLRFSAFSLLLLFVSCSSNNEANTPDEINSAATNAPTTTINTAKPYAAKETLYPWVDPLNLRDTPSTTGKIVTSVPANTPLTYTGEKSEEVDIIVLRGMTYEEPWLQVITADQQTGWAFGGALRRQGEQKGNGIINDLQFDFSHFGQFDLSTWEALPVQDDSSGGDATVYVYTYQKGDQTLEIVRISIGEYGYSQKYKLMAGDGKVLKSRQLDFQIDPLLLTETVSDYRTLPTKTYHRQQRMKKHFMQLNAYPQMVNRAWKQADPKLPNIQ